MKITSRRRRLAVGCSSILAAVAMATAVAGPASAAPSVQQLTDYIKAGVKPASSSTVQGTANRLASPQAVSGPVAFPAGTNSTSSDTVGYGPRQSSFLAAFGYGAANPNVAPPGANNYACKPKAGQRPVILVHGTWSNAYAPFARMSPDLVAAGYCTFTFNYGKLGIADGGGLISLFPGAYGTGDIPTSAGQLSSFIDRVLAATGSSKVDIVGHSQGGPMARQYLKFNGGAAKVQKLITLGGTNHGTTLDGIGSLGRSVNNLGINVLGFAQLPVGVSGIQQVVGSDFITKLNAGGDTVPGVDYTVVRTKYDEVSTPSEATFLTAGPGATVNNVTLQDGCGVDLSDHLTQTYSPREISIVKRALDPSSPLVCAPNGFLLN